jgi:hypothetical protein
MNSACHPNETSNVAEPKHFIVWVGLWIVALMVLLPVLGR